MLYRLIKYISAKRFSFIMNFQEYLDYAHELISKRFNLDFEKPEMVFDDNLILDSVGIRGTRTSLSFNDVVMMLDPEKNTLGLHEEKNDENQCKNIYAFAHELAYSLISQYNSKLIRTKNAVRLAFKEGMAEYIAIESCKTSTIDKLVEEAGETDILLKDGWKNWLDERVALTKLSRGYCNQDISLEESMINFFKKNPGIMKHYAHSVGYHFVSELNPKDIEPIIKRPPKSYKELLFPEFYNQN